MKTKTNMKVISLLLLICSKTHPSWMLYGCRSMNVSPMNGGDMSSDAAQAGDGSGGRVPDFDDMAVLSDLAVPFVVQWSADESHRLQLDVALAGVAALFCGQFENTVGRLGDFLCDRLSGIDTMRGSTGGAIAIALAGCAAIFAVCG